MVNYNLKDVRDYIIKLYTIIKVFGIKNEDAKYKKIIKLIDDVLEEISKENGFKNKAEAVGKIPLETKLGDKSLACFNQLKEFIKMVEIKN